MWSLLLLMHGSPRQRVGLVGGSGNFGLSAATGRDDTVFHLLSLAHTLCFKAGSQGGRWAPIIPRKWAQDDEVDGSGQQASKEFWDRRKTVPESNLPVVGPPLPLWLSICPSLSGAREAIGQKLVLSHMLSIQRTVTSLLVVMICPPFSAFPTCPRRRLGNSKINYFCAQWVPCRKVGSGC